MTNLTPKQIGDANQQARKAAAETLLRLRGQNVADLKNKDMLSLIALLLQWQGLCDKDGNIK
jgi:hypothetical protein